MFSILRVQSSPKEKLPLRATLWLWSSMSIVASSGTLSMMILNTPVAVRKPKFPFSSILAMSGIEDMGLSASGVMVPHMRRFRTLLASSITAPKSLE